jgi:hypothetical protein
MVFYGGGVRFFCSLSILGGLCYHRQENEPENKSPGPRCSEMAKTAVPTWCLTCMMHPYWKSHCSNTYCITNLKQALEWSSVSDPAADCLPSPLEVVVHGILWPTSSFLSPHHRTPNPGFNSGFSPPFI